MVELRTALGSPRPNLENYRHALETWSAQYLVGRLDGAPVACGMSVLFPWAAGDRHLPADAAVLPAFRSRGIGGQLLRLLSERGRELGKQGLRVEVKSDDPGSIRFVESRGFHEVEREEEVELDLAAIGEPPPAEPPDGIEIVSYNERPDLERGMYETDTEASADIPGEAGTHQPGFEEWRTFAIERPTRDLDLTLLALAGDEVVGVAYMEGYGDRFIHNLTGVRRAWRGRGVATALKRAQIAAAHARGANRLVTESHEDNAPMRNLNRKLGYRPTVTNIVFHGPLLI